MKSSKIITDSKRKSQHGIEARKLKKAKDNIESPHAIEARYYRKQKLTWDRGKTIIELFKRLKANITRVKFGKKF